MTALASRMIELRAGVRAMIAGEGAAECVLFQTELDRNSSGALCTGRSVKFGQVQK